MENPIRTYDTSILERGCEALGIRLSEEQIRQFLMYYEYLTEQNKVMNLTAITDYQEVVQKHFLDSLSIVRVIDMTQINSFIDIGTGAGFPGIPLKIAYPSVKVTLIDSLKKRTDFLNRTIDIIRCDNIEILHGRAEDYGKSAEYREKYDLCVSRAVANLSTLSEYCTPFLKIGGKFISYKSTNIDNEISDSKNALFLLGAKITAKEEFLLPGTDIGRSFVVISKIHSTPKKYPRKAGLPAKEPLSVVLKS